jgi:hypothetical protein
MAQDPEDEYGPDEIFVDTSADLDMVALYRSATAGSEIEADIIRGILDSHGIPTLLSRATGYPSLGFVVHVHRGNYREAARLIEEAKEAGPGAALEAERAWEEGR